MIEKMNLFNKDTNNINKYKPKFLDFEEKLESCNFYKAFRIYSNKTIEQMSIYYNIQWDKLESGKLELGFMELKKIYDFSPNLNLFYNLIKNSIADKLGYTGDGFFHLSNGGIKGEIEPLSRPKCDFGCGFYMGSNLSQALALITQKEKPVLYYLNLDLNDNRIKFKNYDILDWISVIIYHRGYDFLIKNKRYKNIILDHAKKLLEDVNLIYGPIADDKMYYTMSLYLRNQINNDVMTNSLLCMNYGNQFVAKTEEVCKLINIKKEYKLTKFECFIINSYYDKILSTLENRMEEVELKYSDNGSLNFKDMIEKGVE